LLLTDRLDRAIATARRHGSLLALMFMDLDGFKHINDTWGHAVGDEILQSVARRLLAGVRDSDTVSRHGGDEFIVLLSEIACAADAGLSAEKLLAAIALPHRTAEQDLRVTACVGTSLFPVDGQDPATLMRTADLALLRAKSQRRVRPSSATRRDAV
jgi:diguanylate cyclase (GGDEF)-like protein